MIVVVSFKSAHDQNGTGQTSDEQIYLCFIGLLIGHNNA